jgi:hypothetical protein
MNRTLSASAVLLCMCISIVSCTSDSPSSPGNTPAGCEKNTSVTATEGFFLTGGGVTSAEVNMDINVGTFTSNSLVEFGDLLALNTEGTYKFGSNDSLELSLSIAFPAGTGTGNWDNLSSGSGTYGVTLEIRNDTLAGIYKAVSGRTTLSQFYRSTTTDSVSFSGTFCGTLKDSLNRTLTVEGGKFTHSESE